VTLACHGASRAGLVMCLVLVAGCGGTESDFESAESPDGKYTIIVTVVVPNFPHASYKVRAYITSGGGETRQLLAETPLANDGVPFTARNIGLRWTSATTALVCLRPTDLPDQGIRINVSGEPSAQIKPGC